MCLLIFAWRMQDDYALTVGANRDESYDRPTRNFTVLRENDPRTLGGLDEMAGEHGSP